MDPMNLTKVICAWCNRHLNGHTEAERVSHGICNGCLDEALGRPLLCWEELEDDPWIDIGGGG